MGRLITGKVISDKGDKTIVISVTERKTHPLYKKQYTVKSRYMAHDPASEAKVGDRVIISESRPISARKRFVLKQVVEQAGAGFDEADAVADLDSADKEDNK